MWDPDRTGQPGYADTPSFAASPSFYDTAWSVRLATATGGVPAQLDRRRAAAALVSQALGADRSSDATQMPEVERLELGAQALSAMHAPIPSAITHTVERLRVGDRYRSDASGRPNWAATDLAAQALALSRATIPRAVLVNAQHALRAVERAPIHLATIMTSTIPILGTLASSPADLRSSPGVAGLLARARAALLAHGGASGVAAGGLVSLADVASAAGIAAPAVPAHTFDALRNPSGYYDISADLGHGDPQTTYLAVRLGAVLSASGRQTLLAGLVPQGWLGITSAPTLANTFHAVVAAHACGSTPHPAQVSALIAQYLAGLADGRAVSPELSPGASGAATPLATAQACWLARQYHVALSDTRRRGLTAALVTAAGAIDGPNSDGLQAMADTADAARRCRLSLPTSLVSTLSRRLATEPAASASDAAALSLAARALADPALSHRADQAAGRLTASGGLFRNLQASTGADIISTFAGFEATGQPDAARAAARQFQTPWGPAFAPPHHGRAPVVSLATLAAGMSLAAGDLDVPLLY